jgi:2-oxo-4-hydroxy-4-carboxy-5-ureidoimidazoline decarboxylase
VRPIESLNGELSRDEFAEALRPLFEAGAPLAYALYLARPFGGYDELIDTAERLTLAMRFEEQAAVLSAHPPIGARPESVSEASYREQGYASETAFDRAELESVYAELAELNRVYEDRFGFRFVVFVNKRPKSEILSVLKARLHNPRDEELRTAIQAMFQIARDRDAALNTH